MKLRIFCAILMIALLVSACGAPADPSSVPTTDHNQPTASTPIGTQAPTEPGGTEDLCLVRFSLNGLEAWFSQKDDTTMILSTTMKEEISADMLSQMGLDMESAVICIHYSYEGSFVRNEDTYEFPVDKAFMRLELEAEDSQTLRDTLLSLLLNSGSSDQELYEKLLRGETVDVTEQYEGEALRVIFRLNGDQLNYMEMQEGETDRTIYEFNDSGVVTSEKYYRGEVLRSLTEYHDNGMRKKYTGYHENGQISQLSEYDVYGNSLKTIYYGEDGTEEFNESWEYEYYASGKIQVEKQYSNQVLQNMVEYYEDHSLKSMTSYYANGQVSSYNENDEHGNAVKGVMYAEDGTMEWMERSEHTYSDAGKLTLTLIYDMQDALISRKEYDAYGRELRVEFYSAYTGAEPYMVQLNTYYDNGQQQTSEIYHDGLLTQKYEYYESGNDKSRTEYYANGQIQCYYEFPDQFWADPTLVIVYDEQGNILSYSRKETEYYDNGVVKRVREYDQNGNVSAESTFSEQGHQLTMVLYDENGTAFLVCRWEREINADGMLLWEKEYRNDVLTQEDLYYDNGMLKCRSRFRDDTGVIYYYAEWNENGDQILEVEYDEEGKEIWRYEFN